MVKNFLFFWEFGQEYLREWPKPSLVAGRSYVVLRIALLDGKTAER